MRSANQIEKKFFKKMIRNMLILLLFLAICVPYVYTQSPGGISANLRCWLKADAGTDSSTDNADISQWNDQSGNARNGSQSTAGYRPVYLINSDDQMNFNPVIGFNAANFDHMTMPSDLFPDGTGGFSVYTVFRKTSSSGSSIIGFGTSSNNRSLNVGTNGDGLGRFHTYNNAWTPTVSTLVNNVPIQSTYMFESSTRYMSVNSVAYGTSAASINLLSGGSYLGANHGSGTDSNFDGYIAEIIIYSAKSTSTQQNQIESYLAAKYGITKSGNYVNSSNTTIWDASANSSYHNNIAVIGRDDASGLNQLQSASGNGGVQPVIGAAKIISANNDAHNGSFSVDQSFLAWGATTGSTNFATAYEEGNRMERIWKVAKTGTVDSVKVAIPASQLSGATYLNIVISDNAVIDETDERKQMDTEVIGGITYYTATVLLNDGQFFTFMNSEAALPVELTYFGVNCSGNKRIITWETASEYNSNYFTLERSTDEMQWKTIETLTAAGNSSLTVEYIVEDNTSFRDEVYYRLIQSDFDGTKRIYHTVSIKCFEQLEQDQIVIFPNPASGQVYLKSTTSGNGMACIHVYDTRGNMVINQNVILKHGINLMSLDISLFNPGIYLIEVINGDQEPMREKLIIR